MTDASSARSVRLVFEFAAGGLRLLEQHPVNVAGQLTRDRQPGDYVEVRAQDGRPVGRVPVSTGLGSSVEVFPEDPYISGGSSRR